jgi:hypothetical protein
MRKGFSVFFRHELTARNLAFSENEELEIAFNSPHQITVTLRRLRADELKFREESGDILCVVTAQKDPPIELREYFEKIPPPATTPQLEQFGDQIGGELWDYAERTIRLLRWRSGRSGPYIPIRHYGKLEWSLDREHWHHSPRSRPHIMVDFGPPEPQQIKPFGEAVAIMMQQQAEEPLGHELFREAWELRTGNPRSALVLGIAAAEVGFKQCIGTIFPDAEELANPNWSPPLKNLLPRYLPKLYARATINGHALSPPNRWLEIREEGRLIRNQIAHRTRAPLPREKLREILGVIRAWLYLLDIYCGHVWALERLEEKSRKELLEMNQ